MRTRPVWLLYEDRDLAQFESGAIVPGFSDCPWCRAEAWFQIVKGQTSFACDRCGLPFEGQIVVK